MYHKYSMLQRLAAVICSMLAASGATAHHSFAMFDNANVVSLKATVKEFQWTNPHVVLWVYGQEKDTEAADLWSIELTSPGNLTRSGWSRHSLKSGDKLELLISPLRDGGHGGALRQATLLETGQVLVHPGPGALDKPAQ